MEIDNSNVSKHLGQKSEYTSQYDKTLLVREPRQSNRTHLGIDDDNLPFVGYDVWNGYEVTALTNNGLPVVCSVKFVYSCSSKYIVESKSIKLYFNSFSMTKLGVTQQDVIQKLEELAKKDLSDLLETNVDIVATRNVKSLFVADNYPNPFFVWNHNDCITLENSCGENITCSKYIETPSILKVSPTNKNYVHFYHSSLLRSRCRVTAQPDSGDVYIYFKGDKTVELESLLQYIISFRDECHFHEEICETIYKRLWDILQPDELMVRCLYARRGSWDINPERVSNIKLLHNSLSNASLPHVKTPRQ